MDESETISWRRSRRGSLPWRLVRGDDDWACSLAGVGVDGAVVNSSPSLSCTDPIMPLLAVSVGASESTSDDEVVSVLDNVSDSSSLKSSSLNCKSGFGSESSSTLDSKKLGSFGNGDGVRPLERLAEPGGDA